MIIELRLLKNRKRGKNMKKIFLVLALLIFGIMSCGKKDNGEKKLRVGLNAVFAPFE